MSRTTKTRPTEARTGFWVAFAFSVLMLAGAWSWYGAAQFEAQTEQSKALSAGTTMAGFGEVWGGAPLVLIHLLALIALVTFGWRGFRSPGLLLAVVALCVASGVGIGIAQLLWEGELFELGIDNLSYVP